MNCDSYISFGSALEISVVSIFAVFIILGLIAFAISIMGRLLKEEKQEIIAHEPIVNNSIVNLSDVVKDEHKLVAMLVASIDANENDEDVKYRVISIKEI